MHLPFRRSHALVIGVDEYSGVPVLRTAAGDATAVAQLLADTHGFTVYGGKEESTPLLNREATAARLREIIQIELPTVVREDDRLLVYFAGHGISLPSDHGPSGYLLLCDAVREDPSTFLPMRELHDSLLGLPCRHALVILDCCFAGAFRWASMRDSIAPPSIVYRERFNRFVRSPAWQVITSAASNERAFDILSSRDNGAAKHSPFALALLKALRGAGDLNGDGLLTATEIYMYVRDAVQRDTGDELPSQTPGLFPLRRHDCGEFVFRHPEKELILRPAPALTPEANPYRGLESFESRHRALYFGRDSVISNLVDLVETHPLVVVVGPSGTGKSSLVKAGLIPRLKGEEPSRGTDRARWRIFDTIRPGRAPAATLRALTPPVIALIQEPGGDPSARIFVFVDQFEELVTQRTDEAERLDFLSTLSDWIETAPDRIRVVVTIRSDFEAQLEEGPLSSRWRDGRFVVPPMSQDELRQAIERPAEARELQFVPHTLVDRLINEVVQMPGALALLSFTLSELYRRHYDRHEEDRALTEADYLALGGVGRALTHRATEELDALRILDPRYEGTVRRVMLRMVAPAAAEITRRRTPRRELLFADPEENLRVEEVLRQFEAARLLVAGTEPDGTQYVEPAHDELIRGWTTLQRWLENTQDDRHLLQAVESAATMWTERGRSKGDLWNANPRLPQLDAIRKKQDHPLNAVELQFALKSIARRRSRRLQITSLVSLVFIALTALFLYARRNETIATENGTKTLGRLASVIAAESARGLEARAVALQAVQRWLQHSSELPAEVWFGMADALNARRSLTLTQRSHSVTSAMFSPDGALMLALGESGSVYFWDAQSGKPLHTIGGRGSFIRSFDLSSDNTRLVATQSNGAFVYDLHEGKRLFELVGHASSVNSAKFWTEHGAARIVTADEDGQVIIWDGLSGDLVQKLEKHSKPAVDAAFSEDGTQVVSAGEDGTAIVWDVRSGTALRELPGTRRLAGVALSRDLSRVLTWGDGRTWLWNSRSGRCIAALAGDNACAPASGRSSPSTPGRSIAEPAADDAAMFFPDGSRVLTARAGTLTIWKATSGEREGLPLVGGSPQVNAVSLSRDGTRVITGSNDGSARIWAVLYGSAPESVLGGHVGSVRTAAFSSNGERAVTGGIDGTARIWDIRPYEQFPVFTVELEAGDHKLVLSPDGSMVAAAGYLHVVTWDAASGRPLAPLTAKASSIAFSPNNSFIATTVDDAAILWRARSGERVFVWKHPGRVDSVSFSSDSSRVVTASGTAATVWSTASDVPLFSISHPAAVRSAEFSSKDDRIVTASEDGSVRVCAGTPGGQCVAIQAHPGIVASTTFSPDGTRVLTASTFDFKAQVWDAATGAPRSPELTDDGPIWAARFSPDGTMVLTNGKHATLWDGSSGWQRSRLEEHDTPAAAFSPDGHRIVTLSSDGTLRLWETRSRRLLCAIRTGKASGSGSVTYFPDGTRILANGRVYPASEAAFIRALCRSTTPVVQISGISKEDKAHLDSFCAGRVD